ncbi:MULTISPECIES: phosphate/phosphite/phosphonate ABC transporter substrate-binding protein [Salinibaculum]|uniref:phosphate/phosphite/phosphonate ABC transporter substrate-binding protein n=1 Tax=Salinibaculum TaxID=2732368 RepID=UPI0030D0AF5B
MRSRRTFLKGVGAIGGIGVLAGCSGDSNDGGSGDGSDGSSGSGGDNSTDGGSGSDGSDSKAYVDNKIKFLMSPSEPQDQLRAQYTPIKERLDSYVDAVDTVEMQYAANYSATLTALGTGTGDIAETGPFAAALGVNSGNAEVLLQRKGYGSWTYSSAIVTRPETDISSLTDLEGKTIGFADALSASGSLYPLSMLKEAGLSVPEEPGSPAGADFTPRWSTHAQAAEALKSGSVDAAGVGYFIVANEDRTGFVDGVEPVEQAEGIPRAPIMVSPQLSEDEKTTVQKAFTEAGDELYIGADGEADTDDDLWFSDVRPASLEKYQPVIDKAKTLGYGADVFE